MKLTARELEALHYGARVRAADQQGPYINMEWEKTNPPGPNGPWRRPAEGVDTGKWVTTSSSVLAMIGVVVHDG